MGQASYDRAMKLLELEMTGFKSFAQTTRFVFDDGITAIIGPNGSGKSNFTESIRWVLGEQSLKSIRGKKSRDVIFAGSQKSKRRGIARVTLTIGNESERLGVEAAEVTFSRTIDRDGTSEYLINGDPVRLFDIQHLLANAGLGAKSYAVISQGTIDQYLAATPQARRELFDEATGIKALQLKLHQAELKLGQADQKAHELAVVLNELAPQLRVLKRQADRWTKREKVSQEFKLAQEQWWHQQWHTRSQNVSKMQTHEAQLVEHIRQARHAREQVESELLQAVQTGTGHGANGPNIEQQLLRAEQDFEREQQVYLSRQQERVDLETSLASIRQQLKRAEKQLSLARIESAPQNLFNQVRDVLQKCRTLVSQLKDGEQIEHSIVLELDDFISHLISTFEKNDTELLAARSLLEHLEGPIQAVARLQAIEHERFQRLQKIGEIIPPSRELVDKLKATVSSQQKNLVGADQAVLEKTLAYVRSEELAAERAGSTGKAATIQAEQTLAEIESIIKRERGSTFLADLQQTSPANEIISEANLQNLAGVLASLGESDPLVIKEYSEAKERHDHLSQQINDVNDTQKNIQSLIRTLKSDINIRFRQQFTAIQHAFNKYFQQLFDGGIARLIITEEPIGSEESQQSTVDDQYGIEITAHPPGKKMQHINMLSGGEKALTSLALLFSIISVQNPPFIILDEVDAALDEANSYRFAQAIKEIAQKTQVVVITHNRETMGSAKIIYGVTMSEDGISKVYSVKMEDLKTTAEADEIRV